MKKNLLFLILIPIFLLGFSTAVSAQDHPVTLMNQTLEQENYNRRWWENYEKNLQEQGLTMKDITQYGYLPKPSEDHALTLGIKPAQLLAAGNLPESYDLREYGRVTPVKNQSPYGNCWAFGSISGVESAILTQNLASEIDLSERHLVYFNYHRKDIDPLGNMEGDAVEVNGDIPYFHVGGFRTDAALTLSNWSGPVQESEAPYSTKDEGWTDLDGALRYNSDAFHVKNIYRYLFSDRDSVKSALQTYGAGVISYGVFAGYFMNGTYKGNDYISYYCHDKTASNHTVSIVGWDDNFPKENFKYTPDGNGAWIIKQSWGVDSDTTVDGYFWLSYYDTTLQNDVYFYEVEPANIYERCYQYDGSNDIHTYQFDKAANIYTAQYDESISAISFAAYTGDDSYTIKIYTDCNETDPESGTLAISVSGSCQNEFVKNIELPQVVLAKKGQRFSVVVDLNGEDIGYYLLDASAFYEWEKPADDDENTILSYQFKYTSYGCPGQSFYYGSGKWNDMNTSCSNDGYNARIKAFTTSATDSESSSAPAASAVSGLNVTANGQSSQLSWNALDNVNYYEIFSADSADSSSWQTAGTSTVPSFTVNNPTIGSVRFYKVRALFTDGQYSGFSEAVRVQSGMSQIMM